MWHRSTILSVSSVAMIGLVLLFAGPSFAWESNFDVDIRPSQHENVPIPVDESSVDIKVESDIPVNIYVMTDEQFVKFESTKVASEYEKSYTSETSKAFDYDASGTLIQWVVIVNEEPSKTANVTVEFQVNEADYACCCGSSILAGLVTLSGVVALLIVLRHR